MIEITIIVMETLIAYFFFSHGISETKKNKTSCIVGIFLLIVISSILTFWGVRPAIKIPCIIICYVLFIRLALKVNLFESIFWPCVFMLIVFLSESITFKLADCLQVNNLYILLLPSMERYGAACIYLILCFLFSYFVMRLRIAKMYLPPKYQVMLISVVVGTIVAIDQLLDLFIEVSSFDMVPKWLWKIEFVSFSMMFCVICLLVLIAKLSKIYEERNALLVKAQEEKYIKEKYEIMKKGMKDLSDFKHDYKNHLQTLQTLLNSNYIEEAAAYIEDQFGILLTEGVLLQSGNLTLDALVTVEKERAEKEKIRFEYQVFGANMLELSPTHLTAVVGNLVDNAIEACRKLERVEERYISLIIKPLRNMMSIYVENSCDGIYIKDDSGSFQTRKTEKGHGLGLQKAVDIVEEYGGFYECRAGEHQFKVSIALPIHEPEAQDRIITKDKSGEEKHD